MIIIFLVVAFFIVWLIDDMTMAKRPTKKLEKELKKQAEEIKRQEEERKRNWQPYKTKVPWRYIHDIDRIFSTYPLEDRRHHRVYIEYGWDGAIEYHYNDNILSISRDEVRGEDARYSVWLKSLNTGVLSITKYDTTTPTIYRPQGSTGWEDHLIYLSEHIDEIIRKEKEEYEAEEQRKWDETHSPLP